MGDPLWLPPPPGVLSVPSAQPCSGLTGHGRGGGSLHTSQRLCFLEPGGQTLHQQREPLSLLGFLGGLTEIVSIENETDQHCSPPGSPSSEAVPGGHVSNLARWSDFPKPQLWVRLASVGSLPSVTCEGLVSGLSVLSCWLCVCLCWYHSAGAVGTRRRHHSGNSAVSAHTGEDCGRGAEPQGGASEGRHCSGDIATQHRHLPPSDTQSRGGREQSLVGGAWQLPPGIALLLCFVLL